MALSGFKHAALSFATLSSLLALGACGGGGDDPPSSGTGTASPQGLWVGTTSSNRTVTGLVLSDGAYYVLYSAVGNANLIAGVVQGTGAVTGNTFSSSDGRDFNRQGLGVLPATVSAGFTSRQAFSGSVSYPSGSPTTFTTAYDAAAYERVPTLAAIAGMYNAQVAGGNVAGAVIISATGEVTDMFTQFCPLSGTVTPRTDGNAYDVVLLFGCPVQQAFNGVAYFDAVTKRLYLMAPNASRTDALLVVGVKI